ncbi:hypothetical protein [Streptomyces diastaticus]|uniref:hypothetical protein n=1 Tax=Streptomyces diastaticus TaxID=1956 RepID=UPI0016796AF9|nr:hypothetical protein [Streptomyces diastaticus]
MFAHLAYQVAVRLSAAAGVAVPLAVPAPAAGGAWGRLLPAAERLPAAVARTGTAASAAMAATTLALAVAALLAGQWPPAVPAGALAAASHAAVAGSARACRERPRLTEGVAVAV